MTIQNINSRLANFESEVAKEPRRAKYWHNYTDSIREYIALPTESKFQTVHREFYKVLDVIHWLLHETLLAQVDLESRTGGHQRQLQYITMVRKALALLSLVWKHVRSTNISLGKPVFDIDYKEGATCPFSDVYVEQKFLAYLQTMCEHVHGKKFKHDMCNALNTLKRIKHRIDLSKPHSVQMIDEYVAVWNVFQQMFMELVFANFVKLANAGIMPCLQIFLDQQIQLKIDLLGEKELLLSKSNTNQIPMTLVYPMAPAG